MFYRNTLVWLLGFILLNLNAIAQKAIQLQGTITNATDDKVIVVNVSNTDIVPKNDQQTIKLSDKGAFQIDIPVTELYNWIIIVHNNKRFDFFAKSGSALQMNVSASNWEQTITFVGNGIEVPEYFVRMQQERGGFMAYYKKLQDASANPTTTFTSTIEDYKKQEQNILDAAYAQKKLPKDFYTYWSQFLTYSVYDAMINYPMIHEMHRQKTNTIQSIAPELYQVTLRTPKIFQDQNLDIPFYQTYIQQYYSSMLMANGLANVVTVDPNTQKEDKSKAFQQTDSALKLIYITMPPKSAAFAAGRVIATESTNWSSDDLRLRMQQYKKQFPKSSYNAALDTLLYNKTKFDAGQPAINFSYTTLEGKPASLKELKGKVVYMDFWASWCGPCRAEMPHAKKIKEHFAGREDVVFLYVSIDENEEAWKKGITSMDISGIHTRTSGWKGEIAQKYGISSVPAYYLINKKGEFVTKQTPRPSQSQEVIRLIESLL
jgi:thiol-disulfide isomerase/thioredoxin